jgi:hypothetical protein
MFIRKRLSGTSYVRYLSCSIKINPESWRAMFTEIVTVFSTARAVIYRSGSMGIINKDKIFHIFIFSAYMSIFISQGQLFKIVLIWMDVMNSVLHILSTFLLSLPDDGQRRSKSVVIQFN